MGKTGVPGEAPYSACFGTGAVLCRLGGTRKPWGLLPKRLPLLLPSQTQPPLLLAAAACVVHVPDVALCVPTQRPVLRAG